MKLLKVFRTVSAELPDFDESSQESVSEGFYYVYDQLLIKYFRKENSASAIIVSIIIEIFNFKTNMSKLNSRFIFRIL